MHYRSWLWTSALHKGLDARKLPAPPDIWVIDLEDSVLSVDKQFAREAAMSWLEQPANYTRGIRINSINSPDGLRDVLFLLDNNIFPDVIVVPKIQSPDEIKVISNLLCLHEGFVKLCATIETLKGFECVVEIAQASPHLFALIFGAADFSAELGVEIDWETLTYARQRIVIAAMQANLIAIDAPCFHLNDNEALKKECALAKKLGYVGKVALKPSQIKTIHDAFSITPFELQQAKSIVNASSEGQISIVNGKMIGPPFVSHALSILKSVKE